VEYLTGLDARIGYPNEHLGKSKIDSVKSPMFATTVGLVLAGYQALDERVNRYTEMTNTPENRVVNEVKPVQKNSGGGGGDFFKKIFERTKGMLIDDFDDKQQNY
jgi:cell division protein FtsA